MKQRIGLAKALLGRPKLLVLDEPINGLDADGMRIVRETLTYLNQEEGVTILVSSHILSELDRIATHYGIIKRGKLLREIKTSRMSEESGDYVAIKTSDDRKAYDLLSGSFETYQQENGGIKLYGVDDNARVTSYLYKNGVSVGFSTLYVTINVLFRRMMGLSITACFFFGTGLPIMAMAFLLGNNSWLNIFLYGSACSASLSAGITEVLVCLICSVMWSAVYMLIAVFILRHRDLARN